MATRSQTYGSFLKSTPQGKIDLPGFPDTCTGTIASIRTHAFDDGKEQRVIKFLEPNLNELGLNATNWDSIAQFTNKPDDDEWIGEKIEVFVVNEPKSKTGYALRVRNPVNTRKPQPERPAPKYETVSDKATCWRVFMGEFNGADAGVMSKELARIRAEDFPGKTDDQFTPDDWRDLCKKAVEGAVPF